MDLRDEFIGRVVRDRSFVDVGGLWGTVNEKVSVAAANGARSLTMVDVSTSDSELWTSFRERIASFGIEECECISSDVCALALDETPRKYDVVHCSGVLYHHPNPVSFLDSLSRITAQHLILTSAVTQEAISNDVGTFQIPAAAAVFVPALDQHERDVLWEYWREEAGVSACYGISTPAPWNPRDFGPWWWLPTPRAMLAMAESVGFQVLDAGPIWNGNAYTVLLAR